MYNKCKIFVPIIVRQTRSGFAYMEHYYKNKQYSFMPCKKPFFSITNEDMTTRGFIDAIRLDNNEDAIGYLSKNFGYDVDIDAVKSFFSGENKRFKCLIDVGNSSAFHKVKSVLITDEKNHSKNIIHFYLIKEPDSLSGWKIFKIVKE